MKIITLDVETTGLAPKGATYEKDFNDYPYIVTIAWKVNNEETKHFIINQEGRDIPEEVTKIHGISTVIANESPHQLYEILQELCLDGVPDLIVGHNIFFDSSTIKANVLRMIKEGKAPDHFYANIEELLHKDRRIDTMKSTIKYCNLPGKFGPKWPRLTELYFKLFGEEMQGAHSSKGDVEATYKCYLKLVELGVIK